MSNPSSQIDRQTRAAFADQDRRIRQAVNNDIIIGDGKRLFIRSPSGHFWQIGMTDAGAVTVTDMGTSNP